jgi:hypothetical protein
MRKHDIDPPLPSIRRELNDGFQGAEGVRCDATNGTAFGLGRMLGADLKENAGLRTEVVLLGRPVNPEAEGFDMSIDVQSLTCPHVMEIPCM